MGNKWKLIVGLVLAISLGILLPAQAYAHGAKIEYTIGMTIEITATYDSGEPMDGAQVTVYAPDEPSTPWLTGICGDDGRFSFAPDTSKPGTWDIQVRQAGHGDIVHIPVAAGSIDTGSSSFTPLQIVLMSVCVIWGCAGTALYFLRRKS